MTNTARIRQKLIQQKIEKGMQPEIEDLSLRGFEDKLRQCNAIVWVNFAAQRIEQHSICL